MLASGTPVRCSIEKIPALAAVTASVRPRWPVTLRLKVCASSMTA